MKKILILDKDDATLHELLTCLQEYGELEIIVTNERNHVNLALQQLSIDLAVIDIEDTEECCFDLIEALNQQFPKLPIDILFAPLTADMESRLATFNVARRFTKPIEAEATAKDIYNQLTNSATGKLQGLSMTSVLQLVNLEKKHCSLAIQSPSGSGELFIHNGEIIAAQTGALTGIDAAYNILSWDEVNIDLLENHFVIDHQISEPLMPLLIEALRLKDEQKLPAIPEAIATAKTTPKPLSMVEKKIIELFGNTPDVIEYSLYDRHNNLRFFYSQRTQTRNNLRPYQLRNKAEQISTILHAGDLSHIVVNEKNSLRHLFFPFNDHCITVGLRRYQNIEKFLHQFKMEFT
ncbi:MAG: DUF4388 domain-containing protein [Thermodesulfobacteriota bacterium]|nr:DUF4388 domain-containing protein [Thermodesulfobacteriota bacterium]